MKKPAMPRCTLLSAERRQEKHSTLTCVPPEPSRVSAAWRSFLRAVSIWRHDEFTCLQGVQAIVQSLYRLQGVAFVRIVFKQFKVPFFKPTYMLHNSPTMHKLSASRFE